MSRGLGTVQRQIITALEQAGQPIWFRDLLHALWGQQPTRSQVERTRQAARALERRALVWRTFAACENYADQMARHRVKVGLPHHPRPTPRPPLSLATIQQAILDVLTTSAHDRVIVTELELRHAQQMGAQWMAYSQFTYSLYRRLHKLTGERPDRQGRLRQAVHRALTQLAQQHAIVIFRAGRQRVYIRRNETA